MAAASPPWKAPLRSSPVVGPNDTTLLRQAQNAIQDATDDFEQAEAPLSNHTALAGASYEDLEYAMSCSLNVYAVHGKVNNDIKIVDSAIRSSEEAFNAQQDIREAIRQLNQYAGDPNETRMLEDFRIAIQDAIEVVPGMRGELDKSYVSNIAQQVGTLQANYKNLSSRYTSLQQDNNNAVKVMTKKRTDWAKEREEYERRIRRTEERAQEVENKSSEKSIEISNLAEQKQALEEQKKVLQGEIAARSPAPEEADQPEFGEEGALELAQEELARAKEVIKDLKETKVLLMEALKIANMSHDTTWEEIVDKEIVVSGDLLRAMKLVGSEWINLAPRNHCLAVDKLKTDLDAKKNELEQLRADHEQQITAMDEKETERLAKLASVMQKKFDKEKKTLMAQIDQVESNKANAVLLSQQEVRSSNRIVAELKTTNTRLEDDLQKARREATESAQVSSTLQTTITEKEQTLNRLQAERETLQKDYDAAKPEADKVSGLEEKIGGLEAQIDQLNVDISTKANTISKKTAKSRRSLQKRLPANQHQELSTSF